MGLYSLLLILQRLIKLKPKTTIFDHFCVMDHPRAKRTKQHKLIDIITSAQRAIAVAYRGRPSLIALSHHLGRDLWC